MKVIVKSKNEPNFIHPYARNKYGDTLSVPDLFAVQRKYAGEVKVREWHKRECNSKTACFETVAKQTDEEVVMLLRKEVERRVLLGEAVKVTIVPKDAEGNNLRPILLANITQENVERMAAIYTARANGKDYSETEMTVLGLNTQSPEEMLAV